MARMPRKLERSDFSALLEELQSGTATTEVKPPVIPKSTTAAFPAPEVSPEKRKRDSLMSNSQMRYAYSASARVLHDRDCRFVQKISDSEFRMVDSFSEEMSFCPKCYRKGLVRAAVSDDFKRVNAYLNVFNLLKASAEDLHTLVVKNRAQLFDVGLDYIGIKVHEDRWYIAVRDQENRLYHNNYYTYGNFERIFKKGYHRQEDGGIQTFHNFVKIMTRYAWTEHVERIKLRQQADKRIKFRKHLDNIPNVIRKQKVISAFAYYTFIDCKKKSRRYFSRNHIQPKIIASKEIPATVYSLVSCRVWRWERRKFLAAMDSLKDYAVATEHFDYGEYCKIELVHSS